MRFARQKSAGHLHDQLELDHLSVVYIQEDYATWNKQGRAKEHGKQLLSHPQMFQIFFDDNDCVHIPSPDSSTHFVRVNTLDAMQDEDYFVKHVRNLSHGTECRALAQQRAIGY